MDASILIFMSIFCLGQPLASTFNFSQYLSDPIHEKLVKLLEEGVFKYSSVLFHLFLFFQSERFVVSLPKLDLEGDPQSVVFWTSLIRNSSTEFSYKYFIDSFVYPIVNMLISSIQTRVSEEIKKVLQFSDQRRTRD